jgi:ubiquitin-activating enzyme E1
LIENITKSNPGIVSLNKAKEHNFSTGDFISLNEVEGMKEVNGPESRPVKVID